MTRPSFTSEGIRDARVRDYAIRFAFGGIIAVICGVVGNTYGLAFGGMAMAFPVILPASLTLVKEHDGRAQAAQDAKGGVLGAFGMAAFALVACRGLIATNAALALALAVVAWSIVASLAWAIVFGRK